MHSAVCVIVHSKRRLIEVRERSLLLQLLRANGLVRAPARLSLASLGRRFVFSILVFILLGIRRRAFAVRVLACAALAIAECRLW